MGKVRPLSEAELKAQTTKAEKPAKAKKAAKAKPAKVQPAKKKLKTITPAGEVLTEVV
jgi:hypothetical protein